MEGNPPSVSSPTMQSLIDGLEVTRESYALVTNPMRSKSPPSEIVISLRDMKPYAQSAIVII